MMQIKKTFGLEHFSARHEFKTSIIKHYQFGQPKTLKRIRVYEQKFGDS